MSIFNVLDILNRRNLFEKHTKIFKINSKYHKSNYLINKNDLRVYKKTLAVYLHIDKFRKKWYHKYRASLKTRLIKEKTDRCGSCKESFRRRAFALQGRLTKQMSCIAVFSQKGFLEMPYNISCTFIQKKLKLPHILTN
jgi:hypothetical protein